jgi:hypothetical protein
LHGLAPDVVDPSVADCIQSLSGPNALSDDSAASPTVNSPLVRADRSAPKPLEL